MSVQDYLASEGEQTVGGEAPIGIVLDISGAGARVVFDQGRLAQLAHHPDHSVAVSGQVSSQIKIRVGNRWMLASVRNQTQSGARGESASALTGGILSQIDFMGESKDDPDAQAIAGFRRGVTAYPTPGALVYATTTQDLEQVYGCDGRAFIQIGSVHPAKDIRAGLYIDAFLGKHFALVGSTGTGKSTAAALILHRICETAPHGHIVMVDPHGEYAAAFGESGVVFDAANLQMPYWLLNFEEHCEVLLTTQGDERQLDAEILAKALHEARSKNRLAEQLGRITVDSPVPYLLSDLNTILGNAMGKLDKGHSSAPYLRIRNRLDDLKSDPRYQFMFSPMLVSDVMVDFISKLFRLPADGRPISIVDVSGIPSEITATVVAVLSRLVFDFAVWGRSDQTRPILLVCEEAHRYVPNERHADGSSVGRILSRIAKEGRKYGIALGLITQRPSDLAEGVLSQCGTILSMRLNNERDQAFVRSAMPEGARGFLDLIPALRNRECIICGEGVTIPLRVSFDNLAAHLRPSSADPSFTALWNGHGGEKDMVTRTVQRWRTQGRG